MITKVLYKTNRQDGGVTVSPNKPLDGVEYTESVRLIADEGKLLTLNGVDTYVCIDVETSEGWYEIDGDVLKAMVGGGTA